MTDLSHISLAVPSGADNVLIVQLRDLTEV